MPNHVDEIDVYRGFAFPYSAISLTRSSQLWLRANFTKISQFVKVEITLSLFLILHTLNMYLFKVDIAMHEHSVKKSQYIIRIFALRNIQIRIQQSYKHL